MAPPLPSDTLDLSRFDREGFARELDALHARLRAGIGEADRQHLRKMKRWSLALSALGLATGALLPNPLSALALAVGNVTRWGCWAHHVSHGGLDAVPGVKEGETSRGFARGWRRWVDWMDWIHPEAWHHEHDFLHHSRTGDPGDPDVTELNVRLMRESNWPRPLKWLVIAFFACTWKLTYYGPNTWHLLQRERRKRAGQALAPEPREAYGWTLLPVWKEGLSFWWRCALPYVAFRFVALPALLLPLGAWAAANACLTLLAAELLANAWAFFIIVPNHSGDDLYRFEDKAKDKGEYYLRQVVGSTNYACGTDGLDFLQAFLNYQVEHHLWPRLPPLKLREAQPQVKALCAKYGIPYTQESVHRRAARLVQLLLGDASMRVARCSEILDAPRAAG